MRRRKKYKQYKRRWFRYLWYLGKLPNPDHILATKGMERYYNRLVRDKNNRSGRVVD